MSHHAKKHPVALSVGILVPSADIAIGDALESLFRQSVFERLCTRHEQCELLVIAHEGAEATIAQARSIFDRMERRHVWHDAFSARVIEIPEQGRAHAWNRFVHEFSAVEARFLAVMDAGIVFHHRDTLYNLTAILGRKPHVPASTSREVNALILKERRTRAERSSLAETALTRAGSGKLCDQLYCLRAPVARSLFLPHDLADAETDFIDEAVRTEYFTRDSNPHRIVAAPEAAHLCAPRVQRHEKMERLTRRAIARTVLHVLSGYLKTLSWHDRLNLADTLRRNETRDPDWLKKLLAAHLRRRPFFWQLFPGLMTLRFKQLMTLRGWKRLTHLPAACAFSAATMLACAGARRVLSQNIAQHLEAAQSTRRVTVPQFGSK